MLYKLLIPIVVIILLNTSSTAAMEAVEEVDKIHFSKKYINLLEEELLTINKILVENQDGLENISSSEIEKVALKQAIKYQSDINLLLLVRRAQVLGNLKELKSVSKRPAKMKFKDAFSGYYKEVQKLYESEQNLARKAMTKILYAKTMDERAKYQRLNAFLLGIEATAFAQSLYVISNTKSYYLFDGRHYLEESVDNSKFKYVNCGDIASILCKNIAGITEVESSFYGTSAYFAHVFNLYSCDDFILIIDGYSGKVQILETGKEKKINAKELSINYLGDWINTGFTFTSDKEQEISNQIYADIDRVLSETEMGKYLDKDNNQEIASFAFTLLMHRFLWLPELAKPEMKFTDQACRCLIKLLAIGHQQNWVEESDDNLIEAKCYLFFSIIKDCEKLGGQVKFREDKVVIDLSQEQRKELFIFITENNIDFEYIERVNLVSMDSTMSFSPVKGFPPLFEVKFSGMTNLMLTE